MIGKSKVWLLAGVACTLAASHAFAAGEKTFKFAHVFPATHKQWTEGGAYWAKLIGEASGGKLKVQQYPAGQLGKESTTLIGSGLADAGLVAPSYEPDKLPLSAVAELPGVTSSACEGSAKMWELVKEGGLIDEAELKPLGLHALYAQVAPQYAIVTTKKKIAALADIKNLKLRANGAAMDKTARALGAVPITVTGSEFFDALSRGTIDGGFWSIEAIRPWGVEKVLDYALSGARTGTAVTIHVMNRRVWDRLDAETKQIVTKAAMETQKHFCSWLDQQVVSEAKILGETSNLKVTQLTPEEHQRWDDLLASVATSWAKDLDSTGRPGTKILEAFRKAPPSF